MRRALALAAVALAAFVLAAPATSATPTEQKLQRQVRVLQRQVKTLQKQVITARILAVAALAYAGCNSAVTSDALQAIQGYPWTAEPSANDFDACKALSDLTGTTITRAPKTATTSVFQQMLNIFK